jgi:hypothetical protein
MRSCAKMSCPARPIATIELQYAAREVIIRDLRAERDPNLLDLCRDHVERLTPPLGWTMRDERTLVPASP